MKNNKDQLYTALLIVLSLFILSFILFFLFKNVIIGESSKKNQNVLEVIFSKDDKVSINNTLPVSDQLGKTFTGDGVAEGIQGYNEFSIKNTSKDEIGYEIYLTKNESDDKELSERYVKLYLTDDNDLAFKSFDCNKLPVFSSLTVLNDMPGGFLLFRGTLNSKEEKNFRLRVWLADSYAISKEKEKFSFTINARVV